jgi:PAS domain S-box-containing protein
MRVRRKSGRAEDHSKGRGRILIVLLTVVSLAMAAAGWWYYRDQKRETEDEAFRELIAVARGKTDQIANWRRERIDDGRVIVASPALPLASRVLASRIPAEPDRDALLKLMRSLTREFLYSDVALVHRDGSVAIHLNLDKTDQADIWKAKRAELAGAAILADDVVLSDLDASTRDGRPLMALVAPVGNLGAFILSIDPARFVYPYLGLWPGSRKTAQSVLVERVGDRVRYLSAEPDAPRDVLFATPKLRVKLPSNEVLAEGWQFARVDVYGVPWLNVVRSVPNSPWFLLCQIHQAEVDATADRLGLEMAAVTLLIALANGLSVSLIWRGHRERLHREQQEVLYAVSNDTPAYLWMTSPDSDTSFINVPFRKFLGLDERAPAKTWAEAVHPDDAAYRLHSLKQAMEARRPHLNEFRVRRFDGQYRNVMSEGAPRFSPSGEFLGYAGSLIDITARKRAEEGLRLANVSLARELEERTQKEQEILTLSTRLIGVQEEERKRLARELHDDLNQRIAALSIATGNLKRHIPEQYEEARAQSDRIQRNLVLLAELVRRISHELHTAVLQYSGLGEALRGYCEEMTNLRISLRIEGALDEVSPSAGLCIYRIAQEALQNVVKHAGVDAATVELVREAGRLRFRVSDAGVGMKAGASEKSTGLGLVSIAERARLAGGSARFESQPGEGTTVIVDIPDGVETGGETEGSRAAPATDEEYV